MMASADGDAVFVEVPRDAFVRHAGNDEGQTSGVAADSAPASRARNFRWSFWRLTFCLSDDNRHCSAVRRTRSCRQNPARARQSAVFPARPPARIISAQRVARSDAPGARRPGAAAPPSQKVPPPNQKALFVFRAAVAARPRLATRCLYHANGSPALSDAVPWSNDDSDTTPFRCSITMHGRCELILKDDTNRAMPMMGAIKTLRNFIMR